MGRRGRGRRGRRGSVRRRRHDKEGMGAGGGVDLEAAFGAGGGVGARSGGGARGGGKFWQPDGVILDSRQT